MLTTLAMFAAGVAMSVVLTADLAAVEPHAPGPAELIVRTVQFGTAEPFFPGLCCIYREGRRVAAKGAALASRKETGYEP